MAFTELLRIEMRGSSTAPIEKIAYSAGVKNPDTTNLSN